jgi:hypothetical protein
MSRPVPESSVAAAGEDEPGHDKPRGPRRRRRIAVAVVLVLAVGAGGAAIAITKPFGDDARPPARVGTGTALATVREGPLSSQVNQNGTLSFKAQSDGTPYPVINQARGIYTWVPPVGKQIKCGQWLYRVEDRPIPLLCGKNPAYRALSEGDSGWDVRQLNAALVSLHYAKRSELDPKSDDFDSETAEAVENLQDHLGVDETGELKLGDAVFLPGPLWIQKVTGKIGTRSGPGAPVLQATTTGREVRVDLNAAQQSEVKAGDRAQITLPDNRVTAGVVDRIGTIASSQDSGSGADSDSGSSAATLPVYITLKHPKDAGKLDQAPVQVQITTGGVKNALIVPVTALIGRAGGGYAVETVDAQNVPHLVPVTLGLFDDADGLVQVTGNLTAGQHVVVPAT